MENKFHTTKTDHSRINETDFENLKFGTLFSDHMFVADYKDGKWSQGEIRPLENLSFHPAMVALHYGQSIFEGMKAFRNVSGEPVLFRPELHAQRLNKSAARLCMPDFPEQKFVDALKALINIDRAWIPNADGSALYIRPMMYASESFLGVRAATEYRLLIFTMPVNKYYDHPVSLIAEEHFVRACEGGVGEAKAAGNYAASLLPAKLAKEKGFDQALWLDGKEFKYIQEVGTMNIFFVIDGVVITPATDGAILKGITRKTLIELCKDKGQAVEERKISIDELIEAGKAGKIEEVFGAGTAAVVSHVNRMKLKDHEFNFEIKQDGVASQLKEQLKNIRIGKLEDKFNWVVPVPSAVLV